MRTPGPAERLTGMTLSGGWTVKGRLPNAGSSDRSLSVSYEVERDGQRGFLKATDYSRAHTSEDFTRAVEEIVTSYNFESDVVELCKGARLSRVVRGIDSGEVFIDGSELPVMYLIFELAEGDVRHHLQQVGADEQVWRLMVLHNAAVGLDQLHRRRVYHQNLKPSHLLTFGDHGAKVGGLSAAWNSGLTSPQCESGIPGDPEYAPVEALYGFELADPLAIRQARDMYLFGSLILFLYQHVTTTTALLHYLDRGRHPRITSESFEEVLPYLEEAFDDVVESLRGAAGISQELVECFQELCHPDPRRRGHPKSHQAKHGSPYSLERYISRLGMLLRRARTDPHRRAA
jgi:eukaryotic-like serine/threonine-protein kinase